MNHKNITKSVCAAGLLISSGAMADVNFDLDDISRWDMVSIDVCLDVSLEKIEGIPKRVELKIEDDKPVYEFEILAENGQRFNVECNAEYGQVKEVERKTTANDPIFRKYAKISMEDARETALDFHPGEVVAIEYEVGFEGTVTYEFDIISELGFEIKVDVDAATGEIEEANFELYEIGESESL